MGRALVHNSLNRHSALRSKKDLLFYCGLLIFPLAQFILFYVIVNFNSLLLSFQKYDYVQGFVFLSPEHFFDNFIHVFQLKEIYNVDVARMFTNSLIIWGVSLIFGTFAAVIFSFYIYKKRRFCNFFKFFLFLPSVIPSVLLTTIYKNFVSDVIQNICVLNGMTFETGKGLIDSANDGAFIFILVYSVWISFGSQVLFYTNAMNQISPAIIEASELDGCSQFRQLRSIVLPAIMPTVGTFLIASIAGFFINQGLMYNFYGTLNNATKFINVGFFIYSNAAPGNYDYYPLMSAFGLCCSFIAIPAVFLLKKFLKRFER